MSRSRARLAADWFAKLRQNAVTQEVEHTDVVAAEAAAAAEATAVETAMQAEVDAIAATAAAYTAADVLAKLKTVDGSGSGLDADLLGGYGSADTSAVNTIVRRNSSGDINARLFRSEYDSTNAGCQYFMTQVNTGADNYLRPSTLAQVRTQVVGAATYGSVGAYIFAADYRTTIMAENAIIAGSTLTPAGVGVAANTTSDRANQSGYPTTGGAFLSGSWRTMGRVGTSSGTNVTRATLFLRIS